MKRLLMIILIFAVGIAISGCTNNGSEADEFETPYQGGNEGLVVEFEQMGTISDTSGANEVWADESFRIETILKNKGEYTLKPGDVRISLKGFARDDFNGITYMERSNPEEIEKVSEYLPEGDQDRLVFADDASYTISFDGFYDAIVQAETTYYYETYLAVPQVCYKYDIRDDSVCNIDESKTFYVSSGPVQVNSVTEKPGGKGIIYLEIVVTNTGGFTGDGKSAIPDGEFRLEYDEIAFTSMDGWECTSGGQETKARLVNGKATIRCRTDVPVDALYLRQFNLGLEYDYRENIRENVRIKEALE